MPSAQLSLVPQGTTLVLCPSGLHTVRLVLLAHWALPGVHANTRQVWVLVLQPWPAGHCVAAPNISPAASQVCTLVGPAQRVVLGVQRYGTHAPALHDWPAGQAEATYSTPSVLQVSMREGSVPRQRRAPGVQARSTQAPSMQVCWAPQGIAV